MPAIIEKLCRTCQQVMTFPEDGAVMACPACGTVNACPQAEGSALEKLARATRQRCTCDFHNAENSYQYVLVEYPDEHEALWGLVQCRYGVEYVDDPLTGRCMPVVHTTLPTPMQEDPDFLQACEMAPEAVRVQYEREAAHIDEAMAAIRARAETLPPFDVFICHKSTRPGTTEYTEDYDRALALCQLLAGQGYRVFLAPAEMKGVPAGERYEATIYHALDTARLMLVVCSNQEYLNSAWVQSEWKRYLRMMASDDGKRLVPLLYGAMSPLRLPKEFRIRKLQAIPMGEMGAQERVLELVRQHVGEPAAPHNAAFRVGEVPGGCQIVGYNGVGGLVEIPAQIDGLEVVSVGDRAFADCASLTGVVFPDSVAAIGVSAFCGTGLTEVTLPPRLNRVSSGAFSRCASLRRVEIPAGVRSIGERAFYGCRSLTEATLPESLERIQNEAFFMCGPMTLEVPEGVTFIGEEAFGDEDGMGRITLRVYENSEAHVYAEDNGTSYALLDAGEPVSAPAPADEITFPSVEEPDGIPDAPGSPATDFTTHAYPDGRLAVYYKGSAAEVIIPREIDGRCVTEIGESAFEDNETLERVVIPEGVTVLGDNCFSGCRALREVVLPSTLKEFGVYCFGFCERLTGVVLPDGLEILCDWIFDGCESLTELTIPAGVTTVGVDFVNSTVLLNVYPGSEGYRQALAQGFSYRLWDGDAGCFGAVQRYSGSGLFVTRELPDGGLAVRGPGRIGEDEVLVPPEIDGKPVREIDANAFRDWFALERVAIPEGVTAVGDAGFAACPLLREVALPATLRRIGGCAFEGCEALESIALPDGLETIAGGAFRGCAALTEVEIPASVTTIGEEAFTWSPQLVLRVYEGTPGARYATEHGFACLLITPGAGEPVLIPAADSAEDYETAPYDDGCEIVRYVGEDDEIVIPAFIGGLPVLRVGDYALRRCGLRRVTISEGVQMIGDSAFDFNHDLQEISLPRTLTYVEERAFDDLPSLHTITVAQGNPQLYVLDGMLLLRHGGELLAYASARTETSVEVPEGVTRICDGAFWGAQKLTEVRLPESLQTIGFNAFHGCSSLKALNLPRSLTRIESGAFFGCKELTVEVSEGSTAHAYAVSNGLKLRLDAASAPVFRDAPEEDFVTERVLPGDRLVTMEAQKTGVIVVRYTGSAETVVIPETIGGLPVLCVAPRAFAGNARLQLVVLPRQLEDVGSSSFIDCPELAEIRMAEHMVSRRFQEHGGVLFMNDDTLYRMPQGQNRTEYIVPEGVVNIQTASFFGCRSLKRVQLPDSVRLLARTVFYGCTALEEINLPENLRRLGDECFSGCTALRQLTIPANVKEFGSNVFKGCVNLTLTVTERSPAHRYAESCDLPCIVLPAEDAPAPEEDFAIEHIQRSSIMPVNGADESVVRIMRYTGTAANVVIPETIGGQQVVSIWHRAFENNRYVTNVTLPAGLVEMSRSVFIGCAKLRRISTAENMRMPYNSRDGVLYFQDWVLMRVPQGQELTSFTVPDEVRVVDTAAFFGCASLTTVRLPAKLEKLNKSVFAGCTSLKQINLPERLQAIGDYCFDSCTSLISLRIPANVKEIGASAFSNCSGLNLLVYENSAAHRYAAKNGMKFSLIGAPAADEKATPETDFVWEAAESGVRITKYTGRAAEVIIPDIIRGQKVVSLWHRAFEGNRSVQSVTLPTWLEELSSSAFINCTALEHLKVAPEHKYTFCVKEDALYLDAGVLFRLPQGTKRTEYTVPEGTRTLMTAAFWGCAGLTSLRLPEGLQTIGKHAFTGCSGLRLMHLPASLKTIHINAFEGCHALRFLIVPASVTEIGANAFADCPQLTLVVEQDSYAHRYALENQVPVKVKPVEPPAPSAAPAAQPAALAAGSIPEGGFSPAQDFSISELPDNACCITRYTGAGGVVNIPDLIQGRIVTEIAPDAFDDEGLVIDEIWLPLGLRSFVANSLLWVGLSRLRVSPHNDSFYAVDNMLMNRDGTFCFYPDGLRAETCTVPADAKVIAEGAIYGNRDLYTLELPEGLREICDSGVSDCQNLTTVLLPESLEVLGEAVFSSCIALKEMTIPAGVRSIGKGCFRSCSQLTLLVHEGSCAHQYCQRNGLSFRLLEEKPAAASAEPAPALPGNSLESDFRVESVFGGCRIIRYVGNEDDVIIPRTIGGKQVVSIGRGAFANGRMKPVSVHLPEGVLEICEGAFTGCKGLQKLTLPEGLQTIESLAFEGCESLRVLMLPASLSRLKPFAFRGCSGLTELKVAPANQHFFAERGVLYSRDHVLLCYPGGLAEEEFNVPDHVWTIGTGAFQDCRLVSVTLPASVTTICEQAFQRSRLLTEVHIAGTLRDVGRAAFSGCPKVQLPAGVRMKFWNKKIMG